jgi:hypothetical protein
VVEVLESPTHVPSCKIVLVFNYDMMALHTFKTNNYEAGASHCSTSLTEEAARCSDSAVCHAVFVTRPREKGICLITASPSVTQT